jgi:cytochrome b6-f complex iron-sulfur subunit
MTTLLLIFIPLFLLAAAVMVLAALRRRDADQAVGYLSRETVARDRKAARRPLAEEPRATGREVERRAEVERAGGAVEPVQPSAPVPFVAPDEEAIGVSRRQFLNRSIVGFFGLGLSGFGVAVVGFLWPQVSGGFGSKIRVGKISDIKAQIQSNNGFYYYPDGRMWITEYPAAALDKARAVYSPSELAGMEAGVVALYQKCVHLGCRVPECETSQWFECPCHGSQYNQVGEKKGGPAPRGLDRFAMSVAGGVLTVDTGLIIQGPPIGTNTTGQEAEGPNCISGGGDH